MNEIKNFHPLWHHKLDVLVVALSFITVGILFLGKNLGLVSTFVFSIVVSWQMLLIVLGLVKLIKRQFIGAAVLIFVGGYFLMPRLNIMGYESLAVWWPVIFIFTGIMILIKRWNRENYGKKYSHNTTVNSISVDGFVTSEVAFGSAKQIVLDPVFKGARLNNSFGHIVLDLRRTSLEADVTFIDVECSFGGIELFIPANWNVFIEADSSFSGCNDKRFPGGEQVDLAHRVVIRGDLSFSGLEIKN